MTELSPQNKSFLIIFTLAFFSTCFAMLLSFDLSTRTSYFDADKRTPLIKDTPGENTVPQVNQVSTESWITYINEEYGFSFKQKPEWRVLAPIKREGFTIFQIDPGKKYYNFYVYISPDRFYLMDGLPATTENIGGHTALNVNNALFGFVENNVHFTFDAGPSLLLLPEFNALVRSVQFQ